ncbi:MAG: carbohydrate binding family 9 domain-containing protein [Gemmatimonadota bacterium]|nr:MAG: carbohydrate binding family 9 domain-containing protein [Gemmatimonadota bacterium]
MICKLLAVLALGALTPLTPAPAPDSLFVIQAVRTAAAPTIDGAIEEGEWKDAAIAENFIQFQPHVGEPSVVFSQALVMYDSTALYVAFRLYDSEPPTAQLTRRDAELMSDDAAVILLDSHHDRRSGYFFVTNALGTQADGQIRDDGRTVDETWDATWSSAAQVSDSGWTAEFAIPFVSLSYTAGDDVTWGINLGRSRRRTLETSYWAGPLEAEARMSQAGSLVGLPVAPPARRYRVIPYGLSRVEEHRHTDWQAGFDARYAVTPEMAAFLTVNPDFAIIEADQERVNLTRFELALDEKRPFFLESAQQFRQRIRTFYTRRISDVRVGGQVLGKQGPWTLTGIATWSEVAVEPPAPGEPEVEPPEATYGIARAQRDVFGSSNVALMAANRTLDGEHQGSLSTDATLFFTRTFGMTAQLAQSWGPFNDGTWAYFIRPAFDSPTSHFHVRYTHLGDHFADNVNVVGFIRDDDRRELDSALDHTFWIRAGPFERIEYGSNYNIYWSQQDTLRSWQIDQELEIQLRSLWSLELEYQEEFKRFEKKYRNRHVGLELGYNTRQFQSVRAGIRAGRNFDADFQLWTATAAIKPTAQLSLEYELERLVLHPDPEDESTWIHVIRADQFFTPDLYLKVFFQTNSKNDRENIQAVFVYRYRPPFGTLQLAYQRGTAEFDEPSQQGNTFFFKVTAVF